VNDQDTQIAQRLQERFAATATQTPKGIHLQVPGVSEPFDLSNAHGELILFAAAWHEHFRDVDALEGFLDAVFSGRVEIVVTYRGKTPFGHQVRVQKDGGMKVVSRTASLVPLFWRPKSREILRYTSSA